jgi:hypothetical protein
MIATAHFAGGTAPATGHSRGLRHISEEEQRSASRLRGPVMSARPKVLWKWWLARSARHAQVTG